jgi:hypothetical protein
MPQARTLADLMKIRAANRAYLDSINSNYGTALGFKRRTGEPTATDDAAIIVFVPEKIHRKWLPASQLIEPELKTGNLKCPLDVVAGGKAGVEQEVPPSGTALAQRLRGWDERIWCGSQISASFGPIVRWGSLGVFVKRRSDGVCGFLTNDHVAIGADLFHPWSPGAPGFVAGTRKIGSRQQSVVEIAVDQWYGNFAVEPDAKVRVDAAFIRLDFQQLSADDIVLEPLMEGPLGASLPTGPLGDPLPIDLTKDLRDLKLIGRPVFQVGRTTGLRKGEIAAFGYEWKDQPGQRRYADLLIKGETTPLATGVEQTFPFSFKGDSGSGVFTIEQGVKRPVALLWGGFQEQLRGGDSQENWSYATALDRILTTFDLEILRDRADLP